jgi:hypothetical protein
MIKIINQDQLIEMLGNYPKHTFASLITETTPKLIKKGRDSGLSPAEKGINAPNIRKYSEFVCGLGFDYQTMILNRLNKEGKDADDYLKGTSWHIPVPGSRVLRQHKDESKRDGFYVNVFCIANNTPKVCYFDCISGNQIEKEQLTEYLPTEHAPSNQGLNEGNEVNVRTFKMTSIKKLVVDGIEYIVKGN